MKRKPKVAKPTDSANRPEAPNLDALINSQRIMSRNLLDQALEQRKLILALKAQMIGRNEIINQRYQSSIISVKVANELEDFLQRHLN